MPTLNLQVRIGSDDGEKLSTGGFFNSTNGGGVFGFQSADHRDNFFRFRGAYLLRAATIDAATFQYYSNSNLSGTCVFSKFGFEDADNPAAPTDDATLDADITAMTTARATNYAVPSTTVVGYQSLAPTGLKDSLQEVVDRQGFAGTLLLLAESSRAQSTGHRAFRMFDWSGSPGTAAKLDVDYTAPPVEVVVLTSGSSWTVPSNWNDDDNVVEVLGGGGGGNHNLTGNRSGGSGQAGCYSKQYNIALTPGASVTYQIGSGGAAGNPASDGGDTWFNGASLAASSVGAKGGKGANGATGGSGNTAAMGVGAVKTTGGAGMNGTNASASGSGASGGGAAGPSGDGGAGRAANAGLTAGSPGGGGANGGTQGSAASGATGGAGGNGPAGTGGGTAASPGNAGTAGTGGGGGGATGSATTSANNKGGAGATGSEWSSAGCGGGGAGGAVGGSDTTSGEGGDGGLYGGGGGGAGLFSATARNGGSGAQGVIVITYTPVVTGSSQRAFYLQRAPFLDGVVRL